MRIITPVVSATVALEELAAVTSPSVALDQVSLEQGPRSIESRVESAFAIPDILRCAVAAEREGIDALVIECLGDPGVREARELVSIPVVGPAEASFHLVAMLAHTFSIVTVLSTLEPMFRESADRCGVDRRLRSVRAIETPVLDLQPDSEQIVRALTDEVIQAVVSDGAAAIVLGCTELGQFRQAVAAKLAAAGHSWVPIVDPLPVAIKTAETLATLRLTHSPATYARPVQPIIDGYDFLPIVERFAQRGR